MADIFELKLITPKGMAVDEMVVSVTIPTLQGQITILPDHINLITRLVAGKCYYKEKDDRGNIHTLLYEISEGFLSVEKNFVRILVGQAKQLTSAIRD